MLRHGLYGIGENGVSEGYQPAKPDNPRGSNRWFAVWSAMVREPCSYFPFGTTIDDDLPFIYTTRTFSIVDLESELYIFLFAFPRVRFLQMAGWIAQSKRKLFDIIEQTKKDIENLELRVAYIGYVSAPFT